MKTLSLKKGVHFAISEIEELSKTNKVTVIALTGGSASGKTNQVTKQILEYFEDKISILYQDDYYYQKSYMQAHPELNFDLPGSIELELISEHLKQLKLGKTIKKPIYSMQKGDRVGYQDFAPNKIILLEGIFVLRDVLESSCDYKIFVDASKHHRLWRRVARNVLVERRNEKSLEDEFAYTLSIALPLHDEYIQPTIENADLIIENNLNPYIEKLPKADVEDLRVRFKVDKDIYKKLKKLGINKSQEYHEITDFYSFRSDLDLQDQFEVIKIKKIGNKKRLVYKIPYPDDKLKVRSRVDININDELEKQVAKMYTKKLTINKTRSRYNGKYDIVVDKVEGLGVFIQFRIKIGEELGEVLSLASKLEINLKDLRSKPYFYSDV